MAWGGGSDQVLPAGVAAKVASGQILFCDLGITYIFVEVEEIAKTQP